MTELYHCVYLQYMRLCSIYICIYMITLQGFSCVVNDGICDCVNVIFKISNERNLAVCLLTVVVTV